MVSFYSYTRILLSAFSPRKNPLVRVILRLYNGSAQTPLFLLEGSVREYNCVIRKLLHVLDQFEMTYFHTQYRLGLHKIESCRRTFRMYNAFKDNFTRKCSAFSNICILQVVLCLSLQLSVHVLDYNVSLKWRKYRGPKIESCSGSAINVVLCLAELEDFTSVGLTCIGACRVSSWSLGTGQVSVLWEETGTCQSSENRLRLSACALTGCTHSKICLKIV